MKLVRKGFRLSIVQGGLNPHVLTRIIHRHQADDAVLVHYRQCMAIAVLYLENADASIHL